MKPSTRAYSAVESFLAAGVNKPCTVDGLIHFFNELYPEQEEASFKLNQIKKKLDK